MQIQELILKTASISRTRLFYNKTLELSIIKEAADTISFKVGKTILTFEKAENEKPYYHIAFNIINNRFSDSFEWIEQKLDILPFENNIPIAVYPDWNAESFYFYDNNGSILEFIVRFDLPYHSTEPFSIKDLVEVSEIGVVVDDVKKTAEELTEKYKIPYFKKGPMLHDFIAMGDDEGLILLSQHTRPWVPTNKLAQYFQVTVKTEDKVINF